MFILLMEAYPTSGGHLLAIDEVRAAPDSWIVEATRTALACSLPAYQYVYVAVKLPRTELPLELTVEGPTDC